MAATILPVRSKDEVFSSVGVEEEEGREVESTVGPELDLLSPGKSTTKYIQTELL